MPCCIFLSGPGGAGKSTAGRIISDILGCAVIDLDDEFCKRYKISGSLYTVKATSPILNRTPRDSGNYWLKITSIIPYLFFSSGFYLLISGGISWKVTKNWSEKRGGRIVNALAEL